MDDVRLDVESRLMNVCQFVLSGWAVSKRSDLNGLNAVTRYLPERGGAGVRNRSCTRKIEDCGQRRLHQAFCSATDTKHPKAKSFKVPCFLRVADSSPCVPNATELFDRDQAVLPSSELPYEIFRCISHPTSKVRGCDSPPSTMRTGPGFGLSLIHI